MTKRKKTLGRFILGCQFRVPSVGAQIARSTFAQCQSLPRSCASFRGRDKIGPYDWGTRIAAAENEPPGEERLIRITRGRSWATRKSVSLESGSGVARDFSTAIVSKLAPAIRVDRV